MRRIHVIAIVLILGVVDAFSQGKVLLILREGSNWGYEASLSGEVAIMSATLKAAGYQPVICSASGNDFVGGARRLPVDVVLSKVVASDYAGMMIPCMCFETRPGPTGKEYTDVVQKANAAGIPIAAQHSGVYVLNVAGLLKGKRYCLNAARVPGAEYAGIGVVRDGLFITSGTCTFLASDGVGPDGSKALTQSLIEAMRGKR